MKHLVLVFLLVLFSAYHAFGQDLKAREIVNLALKKHTSGKVLNRYELLVGYDKPGIAPSALIQPDPFLRLIDSMMIAMPDSQRKEMEIQMVQSKKQMFEDLAEMYAGTEVYYVDIILKLNARLFIHSSPTRGKPDTTRMVYSLNKEHPFSYDLEDNPVALLRFMAMDSSELHSNGIVTFDSVDYKVVQVKIGNKWWDVYFDTKTNLLTKLLISQVDKDPLIGKGPVYSKDIISYSDYKKYGDFLLPGKIEKFDTRQEFTLRKKLSWKSINQLFSNSVFAPEPSYTDRAKFKITPISNHLFVMEQSGHSINERSLLWINQKEQMEMFTDLTNLDDLNEKGYDAIKSKFKGQHLKNVYNIKDHSSLTALSCYFTEQIHITAPKSVGIFSEEKLSYSPTDDSIRIAVRAQGLFTTFEKEFQKDSVIALILNPVRDYENDNIWVTYYLPNQKTLYYDGNAYSANNSSQNALPREKLLYDIIRNRSLSVEKIVYSKSYLDNAPLFMTFQDFETRIKNTDFSIYEKEKK